MLKSWLDDITRSGAELKTRWFNKFHFKVTIRLFPIIVIEKADPLILFSRQSAAKCGSH